MECTKEGNIIIAFISLHVVLLPFSTLEIAKVKPKVTAGKKQSLTHLILVCKDFAFTFRHSSSSTVL